MNIYDIWVDLAPGANDIELCDAIHAWIKHLSQAAPLTVRITRRKFGFGPPELGEFHVQIEANNLTDLDKAFDQAATRSPQEEKLHAAVYSRVTNYKSALYRDFPANERE